MEEMSRKRISESRTSERLSNAIQHIEFQVSSFGDLSDIAWKFLVGQAILDKAQELDISINMESRIDPPKGEPRVYIGEALIDIRPIRGGGNSPANQPNPKPGT